MREGRVGAGHHRASRQRQAEARRLRKGRASGEIDAIAPDSDLDATGTTTTIADIVNNIQRASADTSPPATARTSGSATMFESVRKSVTSGMERLKEERSKWEN